MGTRSLTRVMKDGETLVSFYRQFDGYPEGIGADIKRTLNGGKCTIVNGYQDGEECPSHFNGLGCLAAYLVGQFKGTDIGGVYIMPWSEPGTEKAGWVEYFYTISEKDGKLMLKCVDAGNALIYDGLLKDFDPQMAQAIANGDIDVAAVY